MVSLIKSEKSTAKEIVIKKNSRQWFLVSCAIGLTTGFVVSILDWAVIYITRALHFLLMNPLGALLLPAAGLGLAGVCLSVSRAETGSHGTEEIISGYHRQDGRISLTSVPAKTLASILTVASGGSAGLEGPSIYLGGAIGNFASRMQKKWRLPEIDPKIMLLAGASAAISAIFRAPLTGIVFGLEVPYKDDLSKEALIPALISSTTAYAVFVTAHGTEPLFPVAHMSRTGFSGIMFSVLLGLVVGLIARLFVGLYRQSEHLFARTGLNRTAKMTIGGLLTGFSGVLALWLIGSPAPLGIGYEIIPQVLSKTVTLKVLFGLLALKGFATIATLASGGVGGIFIPMVVMGGIVGAIIGKFIPSGEGNLYPIIGMSSFLSAGYKTPLAAVTFVAETTGSPHYIIPGLVAAAVSYAVSGPLSVSANQRWSRVTNMEQILSTRVGDIMTGNVVTVPAEITISEYFKDYFLKHRHKSIPVVEGAALLGMVALSDAAAVPESEWKQTQIGSIAAKNVLVAFPDQLLSDALDIMNRNDIDRLPVVAEDDDTAIIGIISITDITGSQELAKYWKLQEAAT